MFNNKLVFNGLLGVLILLNFAVQGFNFLSWQSNSGGYYFFDETSMDFPSFVANKAVRLALNCTLLWLIQWRYFTIQSSLFFFLILALIVLGSIDVFYLQQASFFAQRVHQFLHPIVFSPLLAISVLAFMFVPQKK